MGKRIAHSGPGARRSWIAALVAAIALLALPLLASSGAAQLPIPQPDLDDGARGHLGYATLGFTDEWEAWDEAAATGCGGRIHLDLIPDGDDWELHMVVAAHCEPECDLELANTTITARWHQFRTERRLTGEPPNDYLMPQPLMSMCNTALTEHAYGIRLTGDLSTGLTTGEDYMPWGQVTYADGRLTYAGWHLFLGEYYVFQAQLSETREAGVPSRPSLGPDDPLGALR